MRRLIQVEGGVKEEKLSEPGFEGWSVGDAHSKMKTAMSKGLKRGKQDKVTKNHKKTTVADAWKYIWESCSEKQILKETLGQNKERHE